MAALYAQGLPFLGMQGAVRTYAQQMGSVRHLLSDLTLPLISGQWQLGLGGRAGVVGMGWGNGLALTQP